MSIAARSGLICFSYILSLLALQGCSTVRPMAHRGHDLLENPGHSALVRIPAGIGAIVGYTFAAPVGVLLAPTYPLRKWFVMEATGYDVPPAARSVENGRGSSQGDIYIPLAEAPFDYGSGIGSALFGGPVERIARLFSAPPGPPPGTVHEIPEPPPGTEDPGLSFAVHPPVRK